MQNFLWHSIGSAASRSLPAAENIQAHKAAGLQDQYYREEKEQTVLPVC